MTVLQKHSQIGVAVVTVWSHGQQVPLAPAVSRGEYRLGRGATVSALSMWEDVSKRARLSEAGASGVGILDGNPSTLVE